jgi:hypothetical protein
MVVDLSVEDDPESAVFVGKRLMTAFHVNDAEAAHSDAGDAVCVETLVVRSTMRNNTAHFAESGSVGACVPSEFKNASDTAHLLFLRVVS